MIFSHIETNIRIGKAATAINRLTKRVWEIIQLTFKTKILVYPNCVLKSPSMAAKHSRPTCTMRGDVMASTFGVFLDFGGIRWQDKISNNDVLKKADITTVFSKS
jgi:hypothetical protein